MRIETTFTLKSGRKIVLSPDEAAELKEALNEEGRITAPPDYAPEQPFLPWGPDWTTDWAEFGHIRTDIISCEKEAVCVS